jgi:trigger factor
MILGLLVDDLGKQLGLPKAGEKATVKAKGPENHEREELRGKDVTITFTVSRIDRIIPSEVPDLIARYGMESEDQLREAIKTRLTQRGMVEQQSIMRSQVAKHLLDGAKMELPERLTADQAARSLERRRMELLYRGVDEQEIEKHVGEMRSSSAERAQRELKLFFILNQAAEDLDIKITEAEINGHIAQLAMQRGQRPEELRKQVIQSGQVQQIALQIREHKTMDAILAKAEVTEVSAAEFEKMQKEQTEAEKA